MNILTTERLTLRPYIETDFDAFAQMHSDPKLKANTHAKPLNRLQARDLFDEYRAAFDKDGFGMLNVLRRSDDAPLGECGVWYRRDVAAYTLRYTVRSSFWGQGYSVEAVRAVLAEIFEKHGLKSVQAIAMHHNARSVRVLERVGCCQIADDFRGVPGFLRFLLTDADWAASNVLPPAHGVG